MRTWRIRVGRAIAGLTTCLLATTAFAQAQQAAGGLIRAGEAPKLELLYTGDVIGYLDPCG